MKRYDPIVRSQGGGFSEVTPDTSALPATSAQTAPVFVSSTGERLVLKNEAYSCLPFSTPRILSNRDAVFIAVDAHKHARKSKNNPHPDHDWVYSRFSWHSKDFGNGVEIEPPCIWGSHESESFLSDWARELGISRASPIRLQPEIVAISAVEPGKLRVATKSVASA